MSPQFEFHAIVLNTITSANLISEVSVHQTINNRVNGAGQTCHVCVQHIDRPWETTNINDQERGPVNGKPDNDQEYSFSDFHFLDCYSSIARPRGSCS